MRSMQAVLPDASMCGVRAGAGEALAYARAHFTRFQASALADIRRLMGCLCWVRRPAASPYADLMAPGHWDAAAREFARQCCGLLGQARAPAAHCSGWLALRQIGGG